MGYYEEMARYYDLIYFEQDDVEFYLSQAKMNGGPVLELACGTGRVSLALAKAGFKVDALDNSEAMLNEFKKKINAGDQITLHHGSMSDFNLGKKFNLIIIPYRSFHHLATEEERLETLKCIRSHLTSEGMAIIHLYNPDDEDLQMKKKFHFIEKEDLADPSGKKYSIEWYQKVDDNENYARQKIILEIDSMRIEFPMGISYINPFKMQELIAVAGFSNAYAFSDFGRTGGKDSPGEIMWYLQK
jgi:ubiquinone/menaquinone biosynthesis C-methylase UbiE